MPLELRAAVKRVTVHGVTFYVHCPLRRWLEYQQELSKLMQEAAAASDAASRQQSAAAAELAQFRFLQDVVVGWEGIVEDGKPVEYAPEKLADLPVDLLVQLVAEIARPAPELIGENPKGGAPS